MEAEKSLQALFDANRKWSEETKARDPGFFDALGSGHKPKYLWIGCSDARVPADTILGEQPGNTFVHRNIANQVVNNDMNLMSVLQYAVDYLDVKHIMVVGHYDCGGVKAAMSKNNHGSPLENWIRNVRDVMRIHKKELDSIEDDAARLSRLVELNVLEQCVNIYKTHTVQKRRTDTFRMRKRGLGDVKFTYPRVHGLVFHPSDGLVKRLPVKDFLAPYAEELDQIYQVYGPGQTTMDMP